MLITSNIATVLRRVQALKIAVPLAVRQASHVQLWGPLLTATAQETLQNLANDENEEALVPLFVKAISFEILEKGGFRATMRQPGAVDNVVGEAIGIMQRLQTTTYGPLVREKREHIGLGGEDRYAVDLVRKGILDWVTTTKRKKTGPGEKDEGLSNEEIARRIGWILFDPITTETASQKRQTAMDKLAFHIQNFMQSQKREAIGMTAEKVTEWLQAVFAAWRSVIHAQLPLELRERLDRLRQRQVEV